MKRWRQMHWDAEAGDRKARALLEIIGFLSLTLIVLGLALIAYIVIGTIASSNSGYNWFQEVIS